MDTTVRTISNTPDTTPWADGSDHVPNNKGAEANPIEEPVEGEGAESTVLNVLGIPEELKNLAPDDRESLQESTNYLKRYLSQRGLDPTASNFKRALDNVKLQLGMDYDVSGNVVLQRLGTLTKAYKDLAFISDPKEKRSILMKLARQPDSKSINRVLFEEMERRKVWE